MEIGTRLGPYEILGAIGAGGMGEVYVAEDPKLSRKVALKVLPPEMAAKPHSHRSVSCSSPTIVRVEHRVS